MEKNTGKTDNIEYTIVMDPSFTLTGNKDHAHSKNSVAVNSTDRLYAEYESMCLREPTILDSDDAYPHSYQWRIIDRYDPVKIALVKAAIKEGKKIADLEAYQEFLENVSKSKIGPANWE